MVAYVVQLADMVAARVQQGKNYGVVLVPEGLIECVPEVRSARLIARPKMPLCSTEEASGADRLTALALSVA